MTLSKTKFRRAAAKGLSVTLSATTTVWLAGTSMFLAATPVSALNNEVVVTDVTGANPRIAQDGESERVFLGLNLARTDNTDIVQLNAVRVRLDTDDTADEAAEANIETVRLYTDSSLAGTNGVFDSNDALLKEVTRGTAGTGKANTTTTSTSGANVAVGATDIDIASNANLSNGDTIKLGTGTTAEIRVATTVVTDDAAPNNACSSAGPGNTNICIDGMAPTTYAHPSGSAVQETNALVAADAANGFVAISGGVTVVDVGDPGGDGTPAATEDLGFDIPKTDSGSEQGDDAFVVLVTKGGAANQTIKAQVFTSGDVDYMNNTGTAAIVPPTISSGAGTTNGQTKAVTFGADGVAPTITKVESFDTNNDGIVDRFKVYFNESMASGETSSANFKDAIGGTASRINALDASTTDLALGTITWQTTTLLNDTAQIDVTNTGSYTSRLRSTGDVWSVVYDADSTNDLKDATGQALLDTTISSTDKAQPYLVSAEVKDADGDSKIDELAVIYSETMSASSTNAGLDLKNTTVSGSPSYTLGSVLGLKKSSGADANDNDTIRFAVTEFASADVNDTFTLAYTSQTSPAGSFDASAAQNNAQSRSGIAPTLALNPVIVSVEFRDDASGGTGTANNGRIDTVVVTFNVNVTELGSGDLSAEFALSNGYVIPANAEAISGKVLTMDVTEKTIDDTGVVPDLTYTDDGDGVCLVSSGTSCSENQLLTVSSSAVVETDAAPPVLKSVTLYETTANDIWEAGETVQLVMSEGVDPATVSSSWNVNAGTGGTAFTDLQFVDSGNTALADNKIPDSGAVSVSGTVITLTPSVSASAALVSTDKVFFNANEVKDLAANSAYPSAAANGVALSVTPTTAPSVAKVATGDADKDGVLDQLVLYLNGLVKGSTVMAADFGASKGANFTGGENGTSTVSAPADLMITSAMTLNGGNDSRVVVNFAEANEDTGNHPQLKYVQGSLADLAGNKVASFNENTSDTSKFMTGTLTNPSKDEADPVVVLKYLNDRNLNGKVDQLLLVFSETMTATNTSSAGWEVSGHSLASSGAYSDNNDYQQYTFAVTNAVYKVDVAELATESSSMPSVTYASSGVFKDLQSRLLGNVAAGGEKSNVNFAPPPAAHMDGDLLRGTGPAVYVVKHVGSKLFKRHVLSASFDQYYPHLAPFWSKVKVVDDATLNAHSLSAWIRLAGDTKVYEVNDDGSKHWITCADDSVPGKDCANEWSSSGRDADGIYTVNSAELNSYVTGPNVVMPDVAD